jgi:hypothetical protein
VPDLGDLRVSLERGYPWIDEFYPIRRRCRVRILMVADGLDFGSGGFGLDEFREHCGHTREVTPGSRCEHYRLYSDRWYEQLVHRVQLFTHWETVAREGIAALGGATVAGHRIAETLAYLEFVNHELRELSQRWRRRMIELGFM